MSILARITPYKIEEILVEAGNEAEEDICLSLWPVCRGHLRELDRDLKRFGMESLLYDQAHEANDQPSSVKAGGNNGH